MAATLVQASAFRRTPGGYRDRAAHAARPAGRRRGRVVLVGVTGLTLNRADFYENEVTFQVSRSYGSADASDPSSARANFDEVLALMASGALDVAPLLTSTHSFTDAPKIYDDLRRPGAYGLLIEYAVANESLTRTLPGGDWDSRTTGGIGIIGCGNFASRVLVPELRRQGASPSVFGSANGLSAKLLAGSAATATTDTVGSLTRRQRDSGDERTRQRRQGQATPTTSTATKQR